MKLIPLLMIFTTAACTVATQMLLKGLGGLISKNLTEVSISGIIKFLIFLATQPNVILAVLIQGFGFVIWIVVLSREHASVALGVGGASVYVLTALAEWIIYDVRLSVIQLVALSFVTAGAIALSVYSN